MNFFQRNKPILIALGIFLIIACAFSAPILSGKIIKSHDKISWKYFSHEAQSYADSTGELTYWTNCIFSGMPTYTFYGNAKSNILMNVYGKVIEVIKSPIYLFFFSMFFFYLLLSLTKATYWERIIWSVVGTYVAYSTEIINAGHEGKMLTTALFPGILAGVIYLYKGKIWKGILILSIPLFISISMGMQQLEYYMIFILISVSIYYLIKAIKNNSVKDWIKNSAIIIGVAIICLLPAMTNFTPLYDYTQYTMRGGESELTLNKKPEDLNKKKGGLDKDYAFSWSHSVGESFTLLIPDLYGGSSAEKLPEGSHMEETLSELNVPGQYVEQFTQNAPTYWGNQPFVSGPVYFGAIIIFLFVLSLLSLKNPSKWWLIFSILLTLSISMGNNFSSFNYWMFDHFPLFNKFRTPTMVLSLTYVLIVYMSLRGLLAWVREDNKAVAKKQLILSGAITAGVILLLALFGSNFFDFKSQNDSQLIQQYTQMFGNAEAAQKLYHALIEDRISMATSSAWRSLIFIVLAFATMYLFIIDKLKYIYVVGAVGILAFIDNAGIAHRYLNQDDYEDMADYEANFEPRSVDNQILQDPDPYYRVLDLSVNVYNDAYPAYFHKLIGGYSPAKLEAYQDLIDMQLGGEQAKGRFNSAVLDMLNTKYLIAGQKGQEQVYPRVTRNGNAWFVNNIKWVKSANEEMLSLNANFEGDTTVVANPFDSKHVAILRDTSLNAALKGKSFQTDSNSKIKLAEYGLPHLSFISDNAYDGLGVFADIYYSKDWKAYIDGKEVPIYRTNYLLRAVEIPKGHHAIEFKFEPKVLFTAIKISYFGSFLLMTLLAFTIFQLWKKNKRATE